MSNNKILLQKMFTGHFIEEVPENFSKRIAYVWQGDGIWEIRENAIGKFTTHIHKLKTPGLKSDLTERWELKVPKIPPVSLDVTVSFFRQIFSEYSSEVFLQYFYDIEKKEYIINCPQQVVGPASVKYNRDTEYEKGKILVFEIHSHGSMGASFSPIDDADEKDDRFFGVIGNVENYYPSLKIRLSVGGRTREVEVGDIFDLSGTTCYKESFPAEWVDNIKKQKEQRDRFCSNSDIVYYPIDDEEEYPGDGDFPPHNHFEKLRSSQRSLFYDYKDIQNEPSRQELVKKDGKTYMVNNSITREVWKEVGDVESEENNGEHQENSEEKDKWECWNEKDWRNIRW